MSTVIDEKVVEMRFDNKQFESGVSTTMSTLDKLKNSLKFTDSYKGLDNLSKASNNVNMSGLGNAVETVRSKFSALEVIGVTALANITNSAVNASKRIVSSLTIQPITTGFNEYELKMGSIQTIMASTGETLEIVNGYLDELNEYSDKTIYSFSDMTQNIGKFTNAGVKLDDAVLAIKGISNEAAVSGANANEASRAMYNFAQALSAGYVKLIDWKSIENANMATVEFKQQLIDTAVEMGTLTKTTDGYLTITGKSLTATQNFNDTLQEQWMTNDVLIKTLSKYADETTEIGKKAYASAQDVKTFSMMMDTLKESAQSGWARTWEIIVGDFEQAKDMFSKLTKFFDNIISKSSDFRNKILESALGKSFTALGEKVSSMLKPVEKASEALKNVSGSLEDLDKIVNKVIRGDFGNGKERLNELTKAGINYYEVQNKVNETLGSSFRYTEKQIDAQDKLLGKQKEKVETTKEEAKEETKLSETQKEQLKSLAKLNDEQLRNKGYTEEQINALKELQHQAEKVGIPFDDFIDNLDEINGRWLIIDTFKNIGNAIKNFAKIIKDSWNKIFHGTTDSDKIIDKNASALYNIIAALHKFSTNLELSEKAADNFKRIFEGLFAGFQLVTGVIKLSLTTGIKLLSAVLELFGTDILSVTAYIADYIVKLRNWVNEHTFIINSIDKVAEVIKVLIEGIRDCIKEFANLNKIKKIISDIGEFFKKTFNGADGVFKNLSVNGFIDALKNAFDKIKSWIKGIDTTDNIVEYIFKGFFNAVKKGILYIINEISNAGQKIMSILRNKFGGKSGSTAEIGKNLLLGLANGIKEGFKYVVNAAIEIGKAVIEAFRNIFGVHSPSVVFMAIGAFLMAGLSEGIKAGFPKVFESLSNIFASIFEGIRDLLINFFNYIREIDIGGALAAAFGVGTLALIKKFINAIDKFANPFDKLGNVLDAFAYSLKVNKWKAISAMVLDAAKAIALVAGAIFLLSKIENTDAAWDAVLLIGAIAGELIIVVAALSIFAKNTSFIDSGKLALTIVSIGICMLLMANVANKLKYMDSAQLETITAFILAFSLVISVIFVVFKKLEGVNIEHGAKSLLAIGAAILLIAWSAKIISKMEWKDLGKAGAALGGFLVVIGALLAIIKAGKPLVADVGSTIFKIGAAMLILAITAKIIAGMEWSEMGKAAVGIILLSAIITGLIAATRLAGNNLDKVGATMIGIGAAILLLSISAKIIGNMEWDELWKGVTGVAIFGLIVAGLIWSTKLASDKDLKGAAATILMISLSLTLLAATALILSFMKIEQLAKGISAVAIIGLILGGLIAVAHNLGNAKGTLIAMTAAIAVMAIAIAALCMINDQSKLRNAAMSLGLVMTTFAILMKVMKNFNMSTGDLAKSIIALGVLIGVLWALTKALKILSSPELNSENALSNAAGLSILLLSLSGAMYILSYSKGINLKDMSKSALALAELAVVMELLALVLATMSALNVSDAIPNAIALSILAGVMTLLLIPLIAVGFLAAEALVGVSVLAAMAIPLIAFVGVLAAMQGVEHAKENATILAGLAIVLTLLLIPLSLIGALIIPAALGILALTAMAVPLIAFVGVLAAMQGIENAQKNADLLTGLMKAMAVTLIQLAPIGPLAIIGVGAIVALSSVMVGLGILAASIGKLISWFPSLQTFVDTGIALLEKLAKGLGSIIGNFVGGFASGVANGLPQIGAKLSEFITLAMPFINGIKMVDETVLTGIKNLSVAILLLTAASLLEGLTSFSPFSSSLSRMGKDLSDFATNASPFFDSISKINSDIITSVKALAETLLILTGASLLDRLANIGNLFGESSLAEFGGELGSLGSSLNTFIKNLGTFTEDQVSTIECASKAIKYLAEAADEIPGTDGLWQKIAGEKSLAAFGGELGSLGTNLNTFITNLGTFTEGQVTTVECASKAIKYLAEAADEIPRTDGLWQNIVGEKSLATFGGELGTLGTGLNDFIVNLGTFNKDQVATVECACDAITALADAANSIPRTDGLWQKIVGEKSLAAFSDQLPPLATDLKNFVNNLGTFTSARVASVNSAVGVVTAFASLGKIDIEKTGNQLGGFGEKIIAFSTQLKDFASNMSNVGSNSINAAKDKLKEIISVCEIAADANINAMKNFGDSLKELANNALDGFVAEFGKATPKEDLSNSAKSLVDSYIDGIEGKEEDANKAGKTIIDSAVDGIEDSNAITEVETAGKDFGDGLIKGIKAKEPDVYNAGYALGKKAVQGEKDGQKSSSPSKLTMQSGKWFGEGLIIGITKMGNSVYDAGYDVGEIAVNSLSSAIAKISSLVDSDIDFQPTIRPVLDLSDVQSGAGAISGLFDMYPSVGVLSNVNAINRSMSRGQNGSNDIISAIKDLGNKVDNMPRNNYSINGINYSEGDDVSEALKTIVRAARIERRS